MSRLMRVADRLEGVVLWAGSAAKWLFLPLIFAILFDVIARKIPGASYFIMQTWLVDFVSSTRLQELEWHLHGALLANVLAYSYAFDGQVRIDLFREKRSYRTKLWIEFVGITFVLTPYVLLLLYFGGEFFYSSYTSGEGSYAMSSGLPYRWFIKGLVVFGFALLLLIGIAVWLRLLAALIGRPDAGRTADFDDIAFPAVKRYGTAGRPTPEI